MAPPRNFSGVSLSPPPLHHLRQVPSHLALSGLASPRSVMTPKSAMTPRSPGVQGFQTPTPTRYSFGSPFGGSAAAPVAWPSPQRPYRAPPARQSFTAPVKVRAAVRNLSTSSTTSTVSTQNSSLDRAPSREPRPMTQKERLEKELESLDEEMRELCQGMDSDKDGFISRWDFFKAVQKNELVAKTLLPGRDAQMAMKCADTFDEVERIFRHMAGSKGRITYTDLAMYWQAAQVPKEKLASDLHDIFKIIDVDGCGEISRLALLNAVEASPLVAVRLLPGVNCQEPEEIFTATQAV
ncbi:unnamed protein product [Durusdinium trenchii]|uniref:EF-hand domain-containing protein n=1 Tax=Durusdinium trenchii TaxID=1381693 RepID=A0ABP0IW16_9DINO